MKTPHASLLLFATLAGFVASSAPAATKAWTPTVSTDWFNDLNWSPFGVPVDGDMVIFAGGTMNISAPLEFSGTFVWRAGILNGTANGLRLATNTFMLMQPGNFKVLQCPLVNEGTILLQTNSALYLDNGLGTARLVNHGRLESQGDDSFLVWGTGGGRVENHGLFIKTGGAGATSLAVGIPLVNTGTVEAQTGTIQIASGTLSGSFTGQGVNHWAGGFLLSGSVNSSNVLINADLHGTNATLTGNWTWQTGRLGPAAGNSLTVASNAVLTLVPGSWKYLHCALTNLGTVRLTGSSALFLDNGLGTARLINLSLVDSTSNDSFAVSGTGGGVVDNRALLRKSGGTATSLASGIPLVNTGTVEAQTGTIQLASGTLSGSFTGEGVNHWAGGFLLSGSVNSSNVLINADLHGTNATLTGNWTWQTGRLGPAAGNSLTVASNAVLTLVPGNWKYLHCALTNLGTVRLTGSSALFLDNGLGTARLINLSLVDSTSNDSFAVSGTGGGVVDNRALLRKSGGTATSLASGIPLVNTGMVEAQTGTLQIANGTLSGSFTGEGINHWAGGFLLNGTVNSSNVLINADLYGTNATLTGNWTWQTGRLGPAADNSFTLASNALLLLIPGNYKYLHSALTNLGTIRLTGNTALFLDHGLSLARLVNLGLVDSASSDLFAASGTVGGVIDNRATFAKTGGNGGSVVAGDLLFLNTSSGLVHVQTQSLNLQNGDLTGTFTGPAKTILTGSHILRDDLTAQNLEMNSGNFTSSNLRLHGAVTWVTGNFFCHPPGAAATIAADAVLTLTPGNFKYLHGPLTNRGIVRLTGNTALYLNNAPGNTRLINLNLLDSASSDLFAASGTVGGVIDNRATFAKTGGNGGSVVAGDLLFRNTSSGTVHVQAQSLSLQNGDLSGVFIGAGKTILTGNHIFRDDLIAQNLEMQSGNFHAGGARLHGTITWVTGNFFTEAGGQGGTLATDCTFTLVPGNFKYLHGSLTNRGAIQLTGNTALYLNNSGGHARLANHGLVESQGSDLFATSGTGGGVLENRGWWRKTGGTVTTLANDLWFIHGGALEAFKGAFSVNGGAFIQEGGTMSLRLNSAADYGQINFAGIAPLGGGLATQVGPGYSPTIGTEFTVITCSGTNGTFAAYSLAPGYTWSVLVTNTFTRLTVTGATTPGAPAVFTNVEQVASNIFDLHLLVTPNAPYHMEASNQVGPGTAWQYLGPFSSPTANYVYRHTGLGAPPPQQFFRAVSP